MPKGVARGASKGKSVAPRSSAKQPLPSPLSANGIEKWKEGDEFLTMMQEYSFYQKGRKLSPRKEARLYHALFCYDEEPDVSDEEKAMDSDENTELERAIVSAATHHGEKRKCGDLGDVKSDSDGEWTVEGGGDDGRGHGGGGDEGRGSVGDGERTVEGGGDDARGSVGDSDGEGTVGGGW